MSLCVQGRVKVYLAYLVYRAIIARRVTLFWEMTVKQKQETGYK